MLRRRAFEKKLKTTVHHLVTSSKKEVPTADMGLGSNILNSKDFKLYKIIWLLVFTASFGILLYQTYDRFHYYWSEPVAVDFLVEDGSARKIPPIAMCNPDTYFIRGMFDRYLDKKYGRSDYAPEKERRYKNKVLQMLNNSDVINVADVWYKSNLTTVMTKFEVENVKNQTVKLDHVMTVEGICVVIPMDELKHSIGSSIRLEYEIYRYYGSEPARFSLAFLTDDNTMDMKNVKVKILASEPTISFETKKYVFESTRRNPCGARDKFEQCNKECIRRKMISNLPCRFPFFDYGIPNMCENSNMTLKLLKTAVAILRETDSRVECDCLRSCEEVFNNLLTIDYVTVYRDHPWISKFTFKIVTLDVDVVQERLIYDVISLLSDIGGNLGLFLGLSVLSLTDCFLFFGIGRFKNNTEPKHEVHKIVHKKISSVYQIILSEKQNMSQQKKPSCLEKCRYLLLIIIAVWSIYNISIKIKTYRDEPTITTIEMIIEPYVQFPTLTLCGVDLAGNSIGSRSRMFGEFHRYSLKEITDQWIFESPEYTVANAWKDARIENTYKEAIYSNQMFSEPESTVNGTRTIIATPFGQCTQLTSGPVLYSGTATQTLIHFYQHFWMDQNGLPRNLWFFATIPGEPIDYEYGNANSVPYGGMSDLEYDILTIKRKNTRNKPCEQYTTEHYKCLETCMEKNVKKNFICSLPYMKSDIPRCVNSSDGVKVHESYLRSYLTSLRHCNCKIRCDDIIYKTTIVSEVTRQYDFTGVTQYFPTNIFEKRTENEAYSIEKLWTDIGSIIGIGLGLSVLSLNNFVLSLINWIKKKTEK